MQALTRATVVSLLVFWSLSALFFVQPFTGSFAVVAVPAAAIAFVVFLQLRRSTATPPTGTPGDGQASQVSHAAVVLGILLVLIGLMFAFGRWPMLWDPCHTWDDEAGSRMVSPDDPCSSSSSSSQGQAAFILESIGGEGVLLVGGALAVWAGMHARRGVLARVGLAMGLPTVILFRGMSMFFIVAFLAGVTLLIVALLMPAGRRLETPPPSA